MIYRVFLDTNVYVSANYSFHNASFSRLCSLAESGQLQLVINSVIEGEVRAHIEDNVKKAVKELEQATKNRAFASFRNAPDFKESLKISDTEDWVTWALAEFSDFLVSCHVRRIPLNGIDVEAMVEDYFQQRLPFEHRKPEEFKDAIAIRSLIYDMIQVDIDEDVYYCIVSEDKGFREAIRESISEKEIKDNTYIFDNLVQFTDFLSEMDKQMQFMIGYLKSDFGHDLLHGSVEEVLRSSSYEIRHFEEVIDQQLVDIDICSLIPHAIELLNDAGTPSVLHTIIEGEAEIVVNFTFHDESQSYYDKDNGTYIYLISVFATATHRIKFNIPMSFIVSDCLYEDLPFEDDDVYATKKMELDSYVEPVFDLSEENRIYYEELERSGDDDAYDTCPDCGCRIGIENDGGNGFCINCAPNH